MKKSFALLFICIICICPNTSAQFLFSESFVMMPLDTVRRYAGLISGAFTSQTQKEVVNQVATRAELAMRIRGKHVFTIAENFQLVRNGSETILSGGYVYGRFRERIDRRLYPEFSGQYQWLEVRGLEQKIALTSNMRYRIVRTPKLSLATAAGFTLEYEKWGYTGVPDDKLPANTNSVEVYNPRFNAYISYDHEISDKVLLDMAVYYQVCVLKKPTRPRLGAHVRANFGITRHLTYAVTLRIMEDYDPVVPVDPLWYNFANELVFTF